MKTATDGQIGEEMELHCTAICMHAVDSHTLILVGVWLLRSV